MDVAFCPEAEEELDALPPGERAAMLAAIEKLMVRGNQLSYPHSSAVRGTSSALRELRPRGGRSAWRAFYRRIGSVLVIASVGPEAQSNPSGFRRSVAAAERRLAEFEGEERQR